MCRRSASIATTGAVSAAIAEVRRVVKQQGVKAVLVRPNPYNKQLISDPVIDAVLVRGAGTRLHDRPPCRSEWRLPTAGFDRYHDFFQRMIISHPLEQQMACMDIICNGALDEYPRLRVAFLEAGGGWVAW